MEWRRRSGRIVGFILAVGATFLPPAAWAPAVKIGVVEGLSGAPAIVGFGESYLQGIKLKEGGLFPARLRQV